MTISKPNIDKDWGGFFPSSSTNHDRICRREGARHPIGSFFVPSQAGRCWNASELRSAMEAAAPVVPCSRVTG